MSKRKKQSESPTIKAMRSLTQKDAAWLVGLTDRQLRNCPDCPRLPSGRYDAQQVVAWHMERQTDDPMVAAGGQSSPALERWRLARAVDSEIATLKRAGEIESVAVVWQQAKEAFDPCRMFAERMIRDHGADAAEAWNNVVEQSRAIAMKYCPPKAQRRELRVILEDGTILTVPLPLNSE